MHAAPQAKFAGVPIWLPTLNEFKAAVASRMAATGHPVTRLHTLNPEILVKARSNPAYARMLQTAPWSVVDGVGLSLVLRAHGVKVPARICGSDLIHDLAAACVAVGRPLFILGGDPVSLDAAIHNLSAAHPCLSVSGFSPAYGPSLPAEEEHIARELAALRPAVVAVCLGAPRQEQWMHAHQSMLTAADVCIAAGLGGTVDFLAGTAVRAPVHLRKLGLEWAYRLYREPSRWKRQMVLPGFVLRGLLPGCVTRIQPRRTSGAPRTTSFGH